MNIQYVVHMRNHSLKVSDFSVNGSCASWLNETAYFDKTITVSKHKLVHKVEKRKRNCDRKQSKFGGIAAK